MHVLNDILLIVFGGIWGEDSGRNRLLWAWAGTDEVCGKHRWARPISSKLKWPREEVTLDLIGHVPSRAGSSPYDFSKTIVENVKENGEKTQGAGENPF